VLLRAACLVCSQFVGFSHRFGLRSGSCFVNYREQYTG